MKIITIIGKTNTGKSSLFNLLIKKKISIINKKKNTTTRSIEEKKKKNILIDTPGIILNYKDLNCKETNKTTHDAIKKSNLILVNIEENLESEDFFLINLVKKKEKIIVINKIDKLIKKNNILKLMDNISKFKINDIIPISNLKKYNINKLNYLINKFKPKKEIEKYKEKKDTIEIQIIDIIKETLLEYLDKEVPYLTKIEIEKIIKNKNIINEVHLNIKIKKKGHKKIIIGENGKKISKIIKIVAQKIKKRLNLKINNIKIQIKNDNKYRN